MLTDEIIKIFDNHFENILNEKRNRAVLVCRRSNECIIKFSQKYNTWISRCSICTQNYCNYCIHGRIGENIRCEKDMMQYGGQRKKCFIAKSSLLVFKEIFDKGK